MEPSTQDLPFVLLYGPWIWKLVMVGVAGGVLALVIGLRRLAARKAVRATLRLVDDGRESDGVVRGTLGGVGDGPLAGTVSATRAYEHDERAHWRAEELWVETAEGRVMLDGKLTVELGTGGAAKRRVLPPMPAALETAARTLPRLADKTVAITKLVTVKAGDDVVVRGRLERAPSGEDTGFRETSIAWTMYPKTDDEPIRLAARRPRTVLARLSIFAMLALGGGTAFVTYKIEKAVGKKWSEGCWDRDRYQHVDGFITLDSSERCLRAAAMPGQQERVYETLFEALRKHPYRDERTLARLLDVANQTEGCAAMLDILEQHGRFEDIVVHADRCGVWDRKRAALEELGRYDDAARLIHKPGIEDIYTLIAAQRWTDAGAVADLRARDFEKLPHQEDPDGSLAVAALYYHCIAELFRHYDGDPDARARLAELEASEHGQVCLPALVEASTETERGALIARHTKLRTYGYDTGRALDTQAFLEGTGYPYESESAERTLVRLDDPMGLSNARLAWITKLARMPATISDIHRVSALRWVAIGQVLDGDTKAAEATVAHVMALTSHLDANPLEMYPLSDVGLLPAAVALYTSNIVDVDLATAGPTNPRDDDTDRSMRRDSRYFRFGRLPLRAGRPIEAAYFGPDKDYNVALEAAQQGDALLLAQYVANGRWWSDGDLLAVFPHLEKNRDRLVAQLAWTTNHAIWRYTNRTPFELAAAAATRRELYRMIGDQTAIARWSEIYRRTASVLDRRRVMAYVLWDN